jgi:porphobilinogen synthase
MPENFKLELTHRPRRLRRTASLRALTEETVLRPQDFIAPLFVIDGSGGPEAVASMPGVFRLNLADLAKECNALQQLGVPAVALFPSIDPKLKDPDGTVALREDALVLRAVRAVKEAVPELTVMTDLALDPYTTHGHDGVLTPDGRDVDNDRTVGLLCQMAVLHARAGVDLVAPSDRGDSGGARRRAFHRYRDHGVLGEIRLRLLRAVPRCRGEREGGRHPRPEQGHLPAQSGQPSRGVDRGRPR